MKTPLCLLTPFLAVVIASCSSDPEESLVRSKNDAIENPGPTTGSNRDQTEPWVMSEDDNRSRLEACGLVVGADGNVTGISASWTMPANGSSDILFRLELAEDENFTTEYMAFAGLVETFYQVRKLKPNTRYFVRLQAYLQPSQDHDPQAYLVPDENNATSTDYKPYPFAPSEPEIAEATTIRNPLLHPANIELTIGYGKFSAKWNPPANASGKLEYVVGLHADEALKNALDIHLLKEPMVKDWIVEPGFDYWLTVLAVPDPESTNQSDSDSPPLVKQFHVPGNQLDAPGNFKVSPAENMISFSWDPINNNSQTFEYLLMVYLNEEKTEIFGEYHLNVLQYSILGVNQNPRYWFDLQAVPVSGNHSDTASETISRFFELPVRTYATPKINSVNLEALDDPQDLGAMLKLSWDGSANGDGKQKYRVELADDKEFVGGFHDYEEDADSIGAEIGPLDSGRTYYLRMRAVGPLDDGTRVNSEYTDVKTIVTPGTPPPPPPPAAPNE